MRDRSDAYALSVQLTRGPESYLPSTVSLKIIDTKADAIHGYHGVGSELGLGTAANPSPDLGPQDHPAPEQGRRLKDGFFKVPLRPRRRTSEGRGA